MRTTQKQEFVEQETAARTVGASLSHPVNWRQINWRRAHRNVRRLQIRIVQAEQEKKKRKVRALQRILTRSFGGRAIAVKRVTTNRGRQTPGVDKVVWDTPEKKAQAIEDLRKQNRRPQALRRITIPKSNGGVRPLGIPTMHDRAEQALHLLGLEPLAETRGDPNSYGFRPTRSTADAISQCFTMLARKTSAQWVLEGDIRACFDGISHDWLLANIPMDKAKLAQWLKAGYVEAGNWYPSEAGTPQGGIISPVLANLTLDGLERELNKQFAPTKTLASRNQVHLIRYADDFIITSRTKELLAEEVKPLVEKFLAARGLELSATKTRITHIDEGIDFLGVNIRKFDGKLLTQPAKKNVKALLGKVRAEIKAHPQMRAGDLIVKLNPILRGWANYHRHGASWRTFWRVDWQINQALWRWARRRHRKKTGAWVKQKYFPQVDGRQGFSGTSLNRAGEVRSTRLSQAHEAVIRRHSKIKGAANPYDPEWELYFEERAQRQMVERTGGNGRWLKLWLEQKGACVVCGQELEYEGDWHLHHLQKRVEGGSNALSNLVLLHANCHRQVHQQSWRLAKPRPVTGASLKA
ncbi:MAG TPA: group II intron reverse transcriptase/maturase [Blastocatellia bacterium]|nr:group II intron reverse transcriptase/maturase [Blastocatellia bacterium]